MLRLGGSVSPRTHISPQQHTPAKEQANFFKHVPKYGKGHRLTKVKSCSQLCTRSIREKHPFWNEKKKEKTFRRIKINANSFFLALYPPGNVSQFKAETGSSIESDRMTGNGLHMTLNAGLWTTVVSSKFQKYQMPVTFGGKGGNLHLNYFTVAWSHTGHSILLPMLGFVVPDWNTMNTDL
jgi:hypothetical protein